MSYIYVKPCNSHFNRDIDQIDSDKSISHRSAIFSLLSNQSSCINNFLQAEDTLNSLKIVELLGATIEKDGKNVKIAPPDKVVESSHILNCGNSGTAIRLFMGFLASQNGFFILMGDRYLNQRPMRRVADPLRSIGAKIDGRRDGEFAPISIRGSKLDGFRYESKIASAQVKSAMILAALQANSRSYYKETELSRDHSERMLKGMGANIDNSSGYIVINPITKPLDPINIDVPSDPSSGFFFAVLASIFKNSSVTIKNTTLNPTRVEAYRVLEKMGAKVDFILKDSKYEPIGDIKITGDQLNGVEISENISWLIDELPALSIAMACAKGTSIVKNAKELRVKESDRIQTVVNNLQKCGIRASEREDGYQIDGGELKSAEVNSYGDHRVAMSFLIAGVKCGIRVEDVDCIQTSFPGFVEILNTFTEVYYED
jgi:3-phosphoshikimate 1-carboxyvinyltransferase